MNTKVTLIFVLTLMFYGCLTGTQPKDQYSKSSPVVVDNPYLKKYAGRYTVEIKGISGYGTDENAEVYILGANGQAKWMMVKKNGQGGVVTELEQTGTWNATETKINITAGDKSESSTEDFVLLNGTFINTQTDMDVPLSKRHYRYLKPVVNNK